jgi:hypothetical protein
MYPTPCLLTKLNLGSALTALVLRWFGDGGDVGVVTEIFAQGAAEDTHAGAVNEADTRRTALAILRLLRIATWAPSNLATALNPTHNMSFIMRKGREGEWHSNGW